MLSEPQKTYLLELMTALGDLAESFVLVGAQALSFDDRSQRVSKDFDFVLDVVALKDAPSIHDVLEGLGYKPVTPNLHFSKDIPPSGNIMRIEFQATDKLLVPGNDFRVDIQAGLHGFRCHGAEIALKESQFEKVEGNLPDGRPTSIKLRVAKPHALLMLKLLAMRDRYIRPSKSRQADYDRQRARVQCGDCIKIVNVHQRNPGFIVAFWGQFGGESPIKEECHAIIAEYFKDGNAPGAILYREHIQAPTGSVDEAEIDRAIREMNTLNARQV